MTENQSISTDQGLNGDLQDQDNIHGGSSDDEECVRACGDADIDPKSLNRCQDLDDIRSPSPGDRRRSSLGFGEQGVPAGKRVPPRPWPPTSPTSKNQAPVPSKPLVRRGSLKGVAWPPPGYTESNSAQTSSASDGKTRKGPPRQWPPPSKAKSSSSPPMSPTLASLIDENDANSAHDHSYATDSQNDESVVESGVPQDDDRECARACEDVSGDPDALNSCRAYEEDEDDMDATNKESFSESPRASRGTPFTMSPSPPATPEPKTDPSPSPPGSPREHSPARSSSPRSASPVSQHENDKS